MIGTYNYDIAEKMAKAGKLLGMENVSFVCTNDRYDEITLTHSSRLISLNDSELMTTEINASTFGYQKIKLNEIAGSTPQGNSKIILDLFSEPTRNPHFEVVAANTAVALYTSGKYETLEESQKAAEDSIFSGKAMNKLNELVEFGNCV